MRALYIVVEGQTEEIFINNVLRPFFTGKGHLDVRAILVPTSRGHKGGALNYYRFKYFVTNLLKEQQDVLVTSLIDFFRLPNNFPKYNEAEKIIDKLLRVKYLEAAIKKDLNFERFIPYIQLHEFEGLLFSEYGAFNSFLEITAESRNELASLAADFPNPELINDSPETAPSKRLLALFPGYQKTLHGPQIAEKIGIDIIRLKCPHFNEWIETLLASMKETK